MAKGGDFSFADLNKEMSKNSKWGGLMSDGAGVSAITEYIPVGNYACNSFSISMIHIIIIICILHH